MRAVVLATLVWLGLGGMIEARAEARQAATDPAARPLNSLASPPGRGARAGSRALRSQAADDRRADTAAGAPLAPLTATQLAATAKPSPESQQAVEEEQTRQRALDQSSARLRVQLDEMDEWLRRPASPR